MTVFSQLKAVNLREQVAEQIRTAIIEGRLKPNDHIVEAAITEQLGVSRTPVREALILLEREALVVSVPNRGCFVRAFEPDDVRSLFSMRLTLENFAAELVVDQLNKGDFDMLRSLIERQRLYIQLNDFKLVRSTDMHFHQYLINTTHHPMLMRNWQEIVAQVAAVLYLRAEGYRNYDETLAVTDHQAILDAYVSRDVGRVKQENRRIHQRVEAECVYALEQLKLKKASAKN